MQRWMMYLGLVLVSACGCAGTKQLPVEESRGFTVRKFAIPVEAQYQMVAALPDCGPKFEKLFILMPGLTLEVGEWHVCDDAVVEGMPGMECTRIPTTDRSMGGSCKLQVTQTLAQWSALPACNAQEEKLGLGHAKSGYLGRVLVQYDGFPDYNSRAEPVDDGDNLPAIYNDFDHSCLMWVRDGNRVTPDVRGTPLITTSAANLN